MTTTALGPLLAVTLVLASGAVAAGDAPIIEEIVVRGELREQSIDGRCSVK